MEKMYSILIVENDHTMRVALRAAFEIQGHTVHSAADGIEGISLLKSVKPHIIFLDQRMPLLDGEGFLKIKNTEKQWSSIPVVVMSAAEDITSHLGAHAFLQKPFKVEETYELINKLCRRPFDSSAEF